MMSYEWDLDAYAAEGKPNAILYRRLFTDQLSVTLGSHISHPHCVDFLP